MATKVAILSLVFLLIISSVVSAPAEAETVEIQKREDLATPEKEDLKASASHWGGWGGHWGGWGGNYGGHWGGHYGHWPYYGSYWGWPSHGYGYWPYSGYYGHHGYWW